MRNVVNVFIVDPTLKTITPRLIVPSLKIVQRLIGTVKRNLGWRALVRDINGEDLICAAKADLDRDKPEAEWRIRGGENTTGRGLLFGTYQGETDGMWHAPVSREWLERNVVWCEPGADAPADEEPAPKPLLIDQMKQ